MRGPTSSHRSRPASLKAKLIGAAVTAVLAWQTIDISLAVSHGDRSTELTAADYASKSEAAATVAAERRLNDGDPAGAQSFARMALSSSPISAASVRVLGFAWQQQGKWQESNATMSQAAALGWRDIPTQLWLAPAALQMKDYDGAANRLDAVMRADPDVPEFQQIISTASGDPGMARALAKRMTLMTGWRKSYFISTQNDPNDAKARAGLLAALIGTNSPPTDDETASEAMVFVIHNGMHRHEGTVIETAPADVISSAESGE